MSADLSQVDPQWAWSPWEASADRPWDIRTAGHLMRRAGFGASPSELATLVRLGPTAAVASLFDSADENDDFRIQVEHLTDTILATGNPKKLSAAWLYRMLGTPRQLHEKMTLFWHGHFATSAEKVTDAKLMLRQNNLLRENALGDFNVLAQEISRDPAMLIYLDSATNRKSHPNENYARELMELFCLGEGNYTEADVQQVARCFTGWEVRRGKYRFNRFQHDTGQKTFLGKTGDFGGEDAIRIVLQQASAPRFIAQKLVRFFVCDEPQLPAPLIEPLAKQLRSDGFQIGPTVRRILSSQFFHSEHAWQRKIRSPIEMIVGLLRSLQATTDTLQLTEQLVRLGHGLYYPPNVKGWEGGRTWINSSTLLGRARLVRRVIESDKTRFNRQELGEFLTQHAGNQPGRQVDWLANHLLAIELSPDVRGQLIALCRDAEGNDQGHIRDVIYAMATQPEFHLN